MLIYKIIQNILNLFWFIIRYYYRSISHYNLKLFNQMLQLNLLVTEQLLKNKNKCYLLNILLFFDLLTQKPNQIHTINIIIII